MPLIDRFPDALLDFRHFTRFASVGILGAVVDLSISMSLTVLSEVPPEVAKFLGAEVAIVVMFFTNDRWTFRHVDTSNWVQQLRRLGKSNLVRGGGIVVHVIVVYLLVRTGIQMDVGGTDLWPALTMPIAIGCGFLVNYTGETLFTWNRRF